MDWSKYSSISKYFPQSEDGRSQADPAPSLPEEADQEKRDLLDALIREQLSQQRSAPSVLTSDDEKIENDLSADNLSLMQDLLKNTAEKGQEQPTTLPTSGLGSKAKELEIMVNEKDQKINNSVEATASLEDIPSPETNTSVEFSQMKEQLEEIRQEDLLEIQQEIETMTEKQSASQSPQKEQQELNSILNQASITQGVEDKPVLVIPITQSAAKEAKRRNTKYSVKWLWEWCKKEWKIVAGAVIYKEELAQEER